VRFTGTEIQHVEHPKYLGVTLDRTLTYNSHLTKTPKKDSARINIVRKLAGMGWDAGTETIRTATLPIIYSTAEYCAPVWLNSNHISKIDVQLNNAMRIISGCVSTQLPWLPTLAHIAPPKLRRKAAAVRELVNCRRHVNSLLTSNFWNPIPRLVSRRPIWTMEEYSMMALFNISGAWTDYWSAMLPVNGYLLVDPNSCPPGFDLGRHEWVLLNRFRTTQGRYASLMHRWGYVDSPVCDCGADQQTMSHIVNECLSRQVNGGLVELSEAGPNAISFLENLDILL
jgi:hypothetical protein